MRKEEKECKYMIPNKRERSSEMGDKDPPPNCNPQGTG